MQTLSLVLRHKFDYRVQVVSLCSSDSGSRQGRDIGNMMCTDPDHWRSNPGASDPGLSGETADRFSLALQQNELFQIQMRLHSSWLSSPVHDDLLGTFLIPSPFALSLFQFVSSFIKVFSFYGLCSANRAARLDATLMRYAGRDSFLIHNVPVSD